MTGCNRDRDKKQPSRQTGEKSNLNQTVASVIINEELVSISISLSPSIPFNLHLPVKLQVMNGVGKNVIEGEEGRSEERNLKESGES